jgi:hypothetical protein
MRFLEAVRIWYRERPAVQASDTSGRWYADPLAHPDLRRMTSNQLADLPFERPGDPARQAHLHP